MIQNPIAHQWRQSKKFISADGKTKIHKGYVVKHICEDVRGVVVDIATVGQVYFGPVQVDDLVIQSSSCSQRVTNKYHEWHIVPHEEQTHIERFKSWLIVSPVEEDEESEIPYREQVAISGIENLFPDGYINYESGDYPRNIEDALSFLAKYIDELKGDTNVEIERVD